MYIDLILKNSELIILITFLCLFLVFVSQLFSLMFFSKRIKSTLAFKKNSEKFFEQHALDMSNVSGICDTLEDRLCNVEKGLSSVEESALACKDAIDLAQDRDSDAKIYTKALKMIKLGASKNEIAKDCELPEAEIDLLVRLHSEES